MIVREVLPEEKEKFNELAAHPLQSWEWGDFKEKTGVKVIRLGAFEKKELKASYQITIHPLPKVNYNVLYFPKGPLPDKVMLEALGKLGESQKAIFIKMEPNIRENKDVENFLLANDCQKGKSLFTPYSFQLNLRQGEEQLLTDMKPKTRYNIRVAQKHGVQIMEDNSPEAFEQYLRLTRETTQRQKFYAHTEQYHRQMWETMSHSGQTHLFLAKYQNQVLAAHVFFVFNNILYYPFGASTRENQNVMAIYNLMWEAIKFGKKAGCQTFDMWGALGPDPNPKDPWFGFHHFKEGFGGELVKFIGTYDLVINPMLYKFFNLANKLRWLLLHSKTANF